MFQTFALRSSKQILATVLLFASCASIADAQSLRLASTSTGAGTITGRLEVYYSGAWGTVCDDGFTNTNANVACRQLGYQASGNSYIGSFGGGSGSIWLDDVSCNGSELYLWSCSHLAWGSHNCVHGEDVGVTCQTVPTPTPKPTPFPTRPPTAKPSSAPSSEPSSAPSITDLTGGAGGDPHFTTWHGKSFDFHGHCDLVLLHSEAYGGLDIHIRSAPLRHVFSYVSNAAVRLGEDVLEVASEGKHYINGVLQEIGTTGMLSGHLVTSSVNKKRRFTFKVKLEGKTEVILRLYKNWISITVMHAHENDFGDSVGLMGTFQDAAWLGRDGITVHQDIAHFGRDWRVQGDKDGLLFQEPSPFPDHCDEPEETAAMREQRRRLAEATITREEAMEVCEKYGNGAHIEDCVGDVQISGDLEMAQLCVGC